MVGVGVVRQSRSNELAVSSDAVRAEIAGNPRSALPEGVQTLILARRLHDLRARGLANRR